MITSPRLLVKEFKLDVVLTNILVQHVSLLIYKTIVSRHVNYVIIIWGYQHYKISLAQMTVIRSVTCSQYISNDSYTISNM